MIYEEKNELEELIESINNNELFRINREENPVLYSTLVRKLADKIAKYYSKILDAEKFKKYGADIIFVLYDCIMYYDKEKGVPFLNYFNSIFAKKRKIIVAKESADKARGGIKLSSKDNELLIALIKYARSKNCDINDLSVRKTFAEIHGIPLKEVDRLIAINEDAVAVNSSVSGKDGEEVDIFDFVKASKSAEDEVYDKLALRNFALKAEKAFRGLQDRKNTKRLISMLLTAKFVQELQEINIIKSVLSGLSFVSREILAYFVKHGEPPMNKMIAKACGVSEQSASRTFRNFVSKIEKD